MEYEQLYRDIYNKKDWYGSTAHGRCPATRLYPEYKHHIVGDKVLDLGCGRGDLVRMLNDDGHTAIGIDIIVDENEDGLIWADITKPIVGLDDIDTIICIDVLEHIEEEDLDGVLKNIAKAKKAIVAVHNGSSMYEGKDIHVTRWHMDRWSGYFSKWFDIESNEMVAQHEDGQQNLFILVNKNVS